MHPLAAGLAGARRPGRGARGAAIAACAALLMVLAPVVVIFGVEPDCGPGPSAAAPADGSIPAALVPLYHEAERVFDVNWLLLASIHQTETHFGTRLGVSTAGARGQMQFMPATWAAYKHAYTRGRRPASYPAATPTHPDWNDPFDAIMAAGSYLAASAGTQSLRTLSGAPGGAMYRAVFAYNHDDWYVREVVYRAVAWRAAGTDPAPPGRAGGAAATAAAVTLAALAPAQDRDDSGEGGAPALGWPTRAQTITSPFGPRWGRMHEGLDIGAPHGAPVRAAAPGVIVHQGALGGYGNYVCVRHEPALSTCYAHLSAYGPAPQGALVARGALVGLVGDTGAGTGPHLHFEVRLSPGPADPAVNPLPYLTGEPLAPLTDAAAATTAGCGAESAPADGPAPAGTPKHVIDTIVIPIAAELGFDVTVGSVEAANQRHSETTTTGSRSAHKGPAHLAWAADISDDWNATHGSPRMDRLAERLAERFAIPWNGAGVENGHDDRFRYQLIYKVTGVENGGNHLNHVHFGAKVSSDDSGV